MGEKPALPEKLPPNAPEPLATDIVFPDDDDDIVAELGDETVPQYASHEDARERTTAGPRGVDEADATVILDDIPHRDETDSLDGGQVHHRAAISTPHTSSASSGDALGSAEASSGASSHKTTSATRVAPDGGEPCSGSRDRGVARPDVSV